METREQAFEAVMRRATAARKTMGEVLDVAAVSRPTYWRAVNGKQARADSYVPTLRKIESALDQIEAERGA